MAARASFICTKGCSSHAARGCCSTHLIAVCDERQPARHVAVEGANAIQGLHTVQRARCRICRGWNAEAANQMQNTALFEVLSPSSAGVLASTQHGSAAQLSRLSWQDWHEQSRCPQLQTAAGTSPLRLSNQCHQLPVAGQCNLPARGMSRGGATGQAAKSHLATPRGRRTPAAPLRTG